MVPFFEICDSVRGREGNFYGSDGVSEGRECRVPGFGVAPVHYFAVDYADFDVSLKGFPDELKGLSKNSDTKKLGHGITVEYSEFDWDRETDTPRTVSYAWRLRTPWGEYKLFFLILSRKVRRGCVDIRHRLEVTGGGCRLVGVVPILQYLEGLGVSVRSVKDLHLCCDFLVPFVSRDSVMGSVLSVRDAKGQSGRTFNHRGVLETIEVGDYSTERNTYRFIRVYVKDIDTAVKGKEGIYPPVDLLTRIRFEVDLRADKCREFSPVWLYDTAKLFDVFRYETRFFLLAPDDKTPSSWGKFKKNGRNPAETGTLHRPGSRRMSEFARRDWAYFRAYLARLFKRGLTLSKFVPLVVDEYRKYLNRERENAEKHANAFKKRVRDLD